jgi:SNF2 family DNA or RNA helicase
VRFLQEIQRKVEQAIIFSYWHDTLRLAQLTLKRCNLPSVFCDGAKMSQSLTDFTSGKVSFLFLSAQAKASGANLQCATHVVLLDPAGTSAKHGADLEQQAIWRAIRIGQNVALQ